MNRLLTLFSGPVSLVFIMRHLPQHTALLLVLWVGSAASAQNTLSIVSTTDVSDEQVFHLITTYQSENSNLKDSMRGIMKIKVSTLEQRIKNLSALKDKWSKLAEKAQEIADQKQRDSDTQLEQMNAPADQEPAGNNLLVLSASAADALYLQCQSERQRVGWEIAAEEATLETMKKLAGGPQAPVDTAVLEGKVRVAEAALKTASDIFAAASAKYKVGMIKASEFLPAQGDRDQRAAELEIAKAELASGGAPSRSVSEAKIHLAEAALKSAKDIFDYRTEMYKVGLMNTELLKEAEGNYQQQLINLEIAKAELNSQDFKNLTVLEGKVRVAEVAIEAAEVELQNKEALFRKNVISESEVRLARAPLKMRTIELDIAKAELLAQSQQAALSTSDAVVKSLVNLAQLKAREQVLKTQIQRLAKAKQQITAIEKLRSEAAGQRTIHERYLELAMEEQPTIDRLESLKEVLQAAMKADAEPNQVNSNESVVPKNE